VFHANNDQGELATFSLVNSIEEPANLSISQHPFDASSSACFPYDRSIYLYYLKLIESSIGCLVKILIFLLSKMATFELKFYIL